MPKKFEQCLKKKGSKVRTKSLKGGKFIHICIPKKGSSVGGEVKTKKSKKRKKNQKEIIY